MWATVIGSVATPVVTAALMWWLLRGGDAEAPVEDGALVLRYPASFAAFGVLIALTGVGLVALVSFTSGLDLDREGPAVAAVVLMFGIPGVVVIAIQRREIVRIRLDGIESRGAFGRVRQLAWSDVRRVSFGRMMSALSFHGVDGTNLRVSMYLVGTAALADIVERRLADRGGHEAVRELRSFRHNKSAAPKR